LQQHGRLAAEAGAGLRQQGRGWRGIGLRFVWRTTRDIADGPEILALG